jgi:hypothetical protein
MTDTKNERQAQAQQQPMWKIETMRVSERPVRQRKEDRDAS